MQMHELIYFIDYIHYIACFHCVDSGSFGFFPPLSLLPLSTPILAIAMTAIVIIFYGCLIRSCCCFVCGASFCYPLLFTSDGSHAPFFCCIPGFLLLDLSYELFPATFFAATVSVNALISSDDLVSVDALVSIDPVAIVMTAIVIFSFFAAWIDAGFAVALTATQPSAPLTLFASDGSLSTLSRRVLGFLLLMSLASYLLMGRWASSFDALLPLCFLMGYWLSAFWRVTGFLLSTGYRLSALWRVTGFLLWALLAFCIYMGHGLFLSGGSRVSFSSRDIIVLLLPRHWLPPLDGL